MEGDGSGREGWLRERYMVGCRRRSGDAAAAQMRGASSVG